MKKLLKFLKDEEGAAAVEYGVLVALIIAICIVVIGAVGGKVNNAFQKVNSAMGP
jgi:pilus assembly protein Flp/PilA